MSKIHKLFAELESRGELTPMERSTILTALAELRDNIENGNFDSRWYHETWQDMVQAIDDLMRIEN